MSHILVVEDDHDLLELYGFALSKRGRTITAASDSVTASSYLRNPYFCPDVIFLDINMNTGVSGLGLMQMIRLDPRLSHIPIVIVTANDQYRDYALSQGAWDFLVKPVKISELAAIANKLGG
jgi:CheY-like chemotaxis protein